jgi:CBS domain-containing protein
VPVCACSIALAAGLSDASLTHAAELMDDYGVDCLPSQWMGLLGVITRGDLVRYSVSERRRCVACLSYDADSDADRSYRDLGGGD